MNARQAPSGAFAPPPIGLFGRIGRWLRSRPLRAAATLLVLPLTTAAAVVAVSAAPAQAVVGAVGAADPVNGFPAWYEDAAGNRLQPCIDPNDGNCILVATPGVFNPQNPIVFPDNFPDEFFYAIADSDIVSTAGCQGTAPGKASVRLALEGAFINGTPAPNDQMVFGRIRVKVTSGLCPNTRYRFSHPFGNVFLTTNGAGAIPANVGTTDIGCVPLAPQTCDFKAALNSPLMGTAGTGGFLRSAAAPAGYLGDGATLGPIQGGTNGNAFTIAPAPANGAVGATVGNTSDFVVAGKLAGPLTASAVDFAGVDLGAVSADKTITVKNLSNNPITVLATTNVTGADPADFASPVNNCTVVLNRDDTCTLTVRFAPTGVTPGLRSAALEISYTGDVRSPLSVPLVGRATTPGASATADVAPASIAFDGTRLRTISPIRTVTVSNGGDAPLVISDVALTNSGTGSGSSHFLVASNTCQAGSIQPGTSCSVGVRFAPLTAGDHQAQLKITTSIGDQIVALTGTGTGGVAKRSSTIDPNTGYPEWYRDEAGIKLAECIDPGDPYCIMLPDEFFDPALPARFLDPNDDTHSTVHPDGVNWPAEFFYTVTDSDLVETPGCDGGPTGKAFIRMAVEGAFTGDPTPLEQMVFGRIRIVVRGGLCPDTDYTFTYPYGQTVLHTDAAGAIKPAAGTEDVGCAPIAPDVCDFDLALSSRVFGGFLRWDPAVAPAAPPGYLGDAATLHPIVGAPYKADGVNPANFFKIEDADGGLVGETDQFTVMGKLRGPLEATAGVVKDKVTFDPTPQSSTSATSTVTFTNTGTPVGADDGSLTITGTAITGVDSGDFAVTDDQCVNQTLAPNGTCTVSVAFSPTATGDRTATLSLTHTGLNNPKNIALSGIGGAIGSSAAISFSPRSVSFAPLKAGRTSARQAVVVSNVGGTLPLSVDGISITGAANASFAVVDTTCQDLDGVAIPVDPGSTCVIGVAFTPQGAGAVTASLQVDDNAPGARHTVGLSGTGSTVGKAVSAGTDNNGYPSWYQDENGVRIEPCLSTAEPCILLGDATFNPANPVNFPANFPLEFFYSVADSEQLSTPGCPEFGIAPGSVMLRVALEGSFASTTPIAGQQITFTRVRVVLTGGLCPSTTYNFVTPYGVFPFQTDGTGKFGRNAGTQDTGCGAAPCTFADALASPGAIGRTPIDGFLRWDPNVAPGAPDGYLGDAVSLHKVVGGTYVPVNSSTPVNRFEVRDTGDNLLAGTDKFVVSGKIAGPLQTNTKSLAFGHKEINSGATPAQTVSVNNVWPSGVSVTPTITGPAAGAFQLVPSANPATCGNAAVASDGQCSVDVVFNPTSPLVAGNKAAVLTLTPTGLNRPVTVALTGTADPVGVPAISITPGVLAFGTVSFPNTFSTTTTVRNNGTAPLNVQGLTFGGGAPGDYSRVAGPLTDCPAATPFTLAIGASCTLTVQFKPSAIGARTATYVVTSNAASSPTTISLTGTGTASTFSVNNTTLGFSQVNQGTTKSLSLSIKNTGTSTFTPGVPEFTAFNPAAVDNASGPMWSAAGPGCIGTPLAAGRSCNITVTFRANGVRGTTYRATVNLKGDGTTLPALTPVTLSGTVK